MKLKKLLLLILAIIIMFCTDLFSQKLVDIYKKGVIKLEADPNFAQNVDWEKLFGHWDKSPHGKEMGLDKNIAIAGDGSIFVSNRDNYMIYKFSKSGTFLKKFGQEGTKLSRGQFLRRPELYCILGNQFLVIRAWHGGVHLFDLGGNFIKSHKFDFMPVHIEALGKGKMVLSGFTGYKKKGKNFAALLDNKTGKVKQLYHTFYDFRKRTLTHRRNGCMLSIGAPFRNGSARVVATPDGNFLLGFSNNPQLTLYSRKGKILKKISLDFMPVPFTQKDKDKYINGLKESINKGHVPASMLGQLKKKKEFFPRHLPYFYHLMVDSDGYILVFKYPSKEKKYIFQVYSPEGKSICETRIDPGKFSIDRFSRSFLFFKGDLYGIFQLKTSIGTPLRLIRVKLAGTKK